MSDTLLFLRRLAANPLQVSAVAPSSRFLADAMASGVGPDTGRVVEFGPGTGRLTEGLLRAGLKPANLTLIELDATFADHLRARLPGVTVHTTGADRAADVVAPGVERVISGLPLVSMPRPLREAIVGAAMQILAPGGAYVQFSYSETPSLDQAQLDRLGLRVEKHQKVWLNLPPARVYHYLRR